MSAAAHLTILWGGSPIASARVAPGHAVGIAEGGVFTRASRDAALALVVRMHARGATVERAPGGARDAADRRCILTGADVQIEIAAPGRAPVYRRGGAWEPEPVVLRIAVTAEDARPFRRSAIAARGGKVLACVAAAHALALAVAGGAMPALSPFDAAAFDAGAGAPWFPASATPDQAHRDADGEDRFGDAPEVCSALDPPIGRSSSVQGPSDNPDPLVARRRAPSDEPFVCVMGPPHVPWGGDPDAPSVPWDWDDGLGVHAASATGTARGVVEHPGLATCFGPRSEASLCSGDEPPAPPTLADLELAGIGEAPAREARRFRRPARAVAGPVAVAANVPRWLVVSGVRDAVDQARVCYERALEDDPALSGRLDAVLRVRGDAVSVELDPVGDVARSPALRCCVDHAHDRVRRMLPAGTRATARYSIHFGSVASASGDSAG